MGVYTHFLATQVGDIFMLHFCVNSAMHAVLSSEAETSFTQSVLERVRLNLGKYLIL